MDSMEVAHSFEASIVSALFNSRQSVWQDMSAVICEVKEKFEHWNKDRNYEIQELVKELSSVKESLRRSQDMLEGKEIELYGLRRQLLSFYSGRPRCSVCCQVVSNDETKENFEGKSGAHHLVKRAQTMEAVNRKRRTNTSLSSVSMNCPPRLAADKARRPSHKRPCFQPKGDSFGKPKILVRDTQAMVEGNKEDHASTAELDAQSTQDEIESTERPQLAKLARCNATRHPFLATKLSPPSQSYDASLAIENAVNHLNLAEQDTTYMSVSQSTQQVDSERPAVPRTLSTTTMVAKHISRRYLSGKCGGSSANPQTHYQANCALRQTDGRRTVTRHKPTCRHYHPAGKQPQQQPEHQAPLSTSPLDDTGEDLTLPSDFLQSDATVVRTETIIYGDKHHQQQQHKQMPAPDQGTGNRHLPSIGGSPTSLQQPADDDDDENGVGGSHDDSESVFKRPHLLPSRATLTPANCGNRPQTSGQNNNTVAAAGQHSYRPVVSIKSPEVVGVQRRSSSRAGPPPSTPVGFWNLDLGRTELQEGLEGSDKNDVGLGGAPNSGQRPVYRRRRPLTFPKRSGPNPLPN